jgi:hypothetical protein
MEQRPYPFAYAQKDEFFALPKEEQPPHIWECLQYLEWRRELGDLPEEQIDRQVAIMRHIAQDVAKHMARELCAAQAWRNAYDPRWPRYHPDSKDPLYLTGCHPPLLLCLPDTDEEWAEARSEASFQEMTDWFFTPAGMHGFTDEDRAGTREAFDHAQSRSVAMREAEKNLARARERVERASKDLNRALIERGLPPLSSPFTPPKKRKLD